MIHTYTLLRISIYVFFFFKCPPKHNVHAHLTHCCCIYQSRPAMSVRIINMPPLSTGCFLFPSRCSGGLNTTTMIIIHPGYSFFPLFLNVRLIFFFYPRSPYYVVSPVNTTHTHTHACAAITKPDRPKDGGGACGLDVMERVTCYTFYMRSRRHIV